MSHKNLPQGTDNVLVDLGFDDAEALSARAMLALRLNNLIDRHGLSPAQVAALTGLTQSEISQVHRYKLQHVSRQRLTLAMSSHRASPSGRDRGDQ